MKYTTKKWVEQDPEPGDTVKFEHGIEEKRTIIGVYVKQDFGGDVVDIGDRKVIFHDIRGLVMVWK